LTFIQTELGSYVSHLLAHVEVSIW